MGHVLLPVLRGTVPEIGKDMSVPTLILVSVGYGRYAAGRNDLGRRAFIITEFACSSEIEKMGTQIPLSVTPRSACDGPRPRGLFKLSGMKVTTHMAGFVMVRGEQGDSLES